MYEKFDLRENAALSLNYLTGMVDEKLDNLPYWLIIPNKKPAEASHSRVDDAELVASWYEGIDSARKILGTKEGEDVQASFRRHVLKSWGENGLRYHEYYPWSDTNHSSFHEMGYVLSALNRMLINNPDDSEAEMRASGLVKGLKALAVQRKIRSFWAGDTPESEVIYEFPNDIYLRDGGFDYSHHTGRGEQAIRNSIILHALVVRYEIANDEMALDLAIGIANFLVGPSRYFNYKMEFFGHVHSSVWVASGLVRLGRVTENKFYIEKGKAIYDYVCSLSSSFGWVPEFAQWHPMKEEHCETCCIKDMIECSSELIKCGYEEYWNNINLFVRNQMSENQLKNSDYIVVDNSLPDTAKDTYKDIDKRIVGGFSGGSLPNSISLSKFRSVAGCCGGMAPVGLWIAWDKAVSSENGRLTVNIPLDKSTDEYTMTMEYPNEGKICITPSKSCDIAIRVYPWMGENYCGKVDGVVKPFEKEGNVVIFRNIPAGSALVFEHSVETIEKKEIVKDEEYTVVWRGCDVVDLLPHGEHMRLYQRNKDIPKVYPVPEDVVFLGMPVYGPTQQGTAGVKKS